MNNNTIHNDKLLAPFFFGMFGNLYGDISSYSIKETSLAWCQSVQHLPNEIPLSY